MRLNWKFRSLAMLVALALGACGCGGINASQTVSPASFFLPGIMKASPPATNAPVAFAENSNHQAFAQ